MRTLSVAAGVALAVLGAVPALGANLITNGSFETIDLQATPINQFGFVTLHPGTSSLSGWFVSGNTVDVVPSTYWQAVDGRFSVDLTGTPGVGSLTQVVSTTIGASYKLVFALAFNPEDITGEADLLKKLRVTVATAGNAILAQHDYSGVAGTATKSNMHYMAETLTFTATQTSTAISFAGIAPTGVNGSTLYSGPVIDNVSLSVVGGTGNPPPAPEPASLGVLGAGLVGLLARRRRGA